MPLGTTIRLFLADGTADGVWIAEKSNWTGKALMAPRTRYSDLRERDDLDGPGVYLLIGPSEGDLLASRVYVGETDGLRGRLDNHNRNKDFWNRVIVFTSKDGNLNKAHIRYLEARLIRLARDTKRAELENGNVSSLAPLSESDTAEAEAFLREMLLIYPVLGIQVFQRTQHQLTSSPRLHLTGPDTKAEGSEITDGFVVYADSLGRLEAVESIHASGRQLRTVLKENGVLVEEGKHLRLVKDYVFTSPSTAAMVMLGRSANGRTEWMTAEGQELKQLQINRNTGEAP